MDAPQTEYELKFEVEPDQVTRLLRAAWLRAMLVGGPSKRHLRAVYYDTPDWDLRRRAASYRVRKSGRQYCQTLKTPPDQSHQQFARSELETALADATPLPHDIPGDAWPLGEGQLTELAPVFETDIHRVVRTLAPSESAEIEMSVDKGTVRCEEQSESLCEIEFELKHGEPGALLDLGKEVIRTIPARLSAYYKADRGYELASSDSAPWVKADVPSLQRDQTAEEAFAALFSVCLRQVRLNEEHVLRTGHAEAVHQLRVGLRRLRSLFQLYKENLPRKHYDRFAKELKWITTRSGAVRDWDVFVEQRLTPVQKAFPDVNALNMLRDRAVEHLRHARSSLARALRSARYARFLLEAGDWVQHRRWREQSVTEQSAALFSPVADFAAVKLDDMDQKTRKKAKQLAALSPEQRHRARIAVKKTRYAADFFRSLFSGKDTKKYGKRLKTLQDCLGRMNDIANLATMTETLFAAEGEETNTTEAAYASGIMVGWHAAELDRLTAEAQSEWKKLRKTAPFWR